MSVTRGVTLIVEKPAPESGPIVSRVVVELPVNVNVAERRFTGTLSPRRPPSGPVNVVESPIWNVVSGPTFTADAPAIAPAAPVSLMLPAAVDGGIANPN